MTESVIYLAFENAKAPGSDHEMLACKHPLPVVSHAMIAAGVQVLRESGALDFQSDADFLVVQRILEKAMALQQRDDKNSLEKQ